MEKLAFRLIVAMRRPGFWFIVVMLLLITLPHYQEALPFPAFLTQLAEDIGLRRHAFERILYLAPIALGGFIYGQLGAFLISLTALGCMLPRIIFISPYPVDSLFETGAVFILGNIMVISFNALRRERKHSVQLEMSQRELRASEEKYRELFESLQFYLQQVTKAQEEERKRISHELHDESIQALVITGRQLDTMASNDKSLSEASRLSLEELRQQVNKITKELRRLVQGLRPAVLDRLGLLPALEWLANIRKSHYSTRFSIIGKERRVPEDIEMVLFRVTQEALRNVWLHSKATETEITVEFEQVKIRLTIRDNGQGFSVPKNIGDFAKKGKVGLLGIQERVRLVGGIVSVQSELGKGTAITVEILFPLK